MHFHAQCMLLLISGEEEDNRIRVYVLEGILIMVPDEGLEAQIQEETVNGVSARHGQIREWETQL